MRFGDKIRKLLKEKDDSHDILVRTVSSNCINFIESRIEYLAYSNSNDKNFLVDIESKVVYSLMDNGVSLIDSGDIKKEILDIIQKHFENERFTVIRNPTYARWEWLFKC